MLLTILFGIALLGGCAANPYDALRLHILANSDSTFDQSLKIEVRDAILETLDAQNFHTREDAYAYVAQNLQMITQTANEVLSQAGVAYTAQSVLETCEFPDRDYNGQVYPAGEYQALRVLLGEGEGQNWWCVIYPPLCIVSDAQFDALSKDGVTYKSFFAELLQNIWQVNV